MYSYYWTINIRIYKKEFPKNTGLLIGIYSLSMGLVAVIASGSVLSLTNLVNTWTIAISIWGIIPIFVALVWWFYYKEIQLKMRKI